MFTLVLPPLLFYLITLPTLELLFALHFFVLRRHLCLLQNTPVTRLSMSL